MGRKSDYARSSSKPDKERADEAKKKLYIEPLTAKELADYLSEYSRNKVHFDSKKIKHRIEELCELSNGVLKSEDFKRDNNNTNSMFEFSPKIHGILLTLLDTNYFDGRINDRKLNTRENLYRDLTVNINAYLSEEDKQLVMSHPGFANAACECILSEAIFLKLQQLIQINMHSDETIRIKLLKNTYDTISNLLNQNEKEDRHLMSSKMVYKHSLEKFTGGNYLSALFEADALIHFLIDLLAIRIHQKEISTDALKKMTSYLTYYNWVKEISEAGSDPLWCALMELDEKQIIELKNSLEAEAKSTYDYQSLMKRASDFLDHNSPEEMQLLNDLEFITSIRQLLKTESMQNVESIRKFYEASFAKDIYDILNEFCNGDWDTPITRELNRINSILSDKTGKQGNYN